MKYVSYREIWSTARKCIANLRLPWRKTSSSCTCLIARL